MNARPGLERRVTDWLQAEAPAQPPDRMLAAALDRVALVGQDRTLLQWRYGHGPGTRRTALLAAAVALLVGLIGAAVLVGSGRLADETPRPESVVPNVAPVVPTARPVASVAPVTTVGSGTAETDIGRLTWTAIEGDENTIPRTNIFETPDGFAAVEPDLDGRASRFWVSADGLDWATAPMPVPAEGSVGHGVAAGEHWIWSTSDFRLWRSRDFATWTEVDTSPARPPTIQGVRWTSWSHGPVTVGEATVLPWSATGVLALDELLGVTLGPDEALALGTSRESAVLGDERMVYRQRQTIIGPEQESGVPVGSIRVGVSGPSVVVTEAETGRELTRIDSTTLGLPVAELADTINQGGVVPGPGDGVVISAGVASPLEAPPDLASLTVIDGRFVAMSDDYRGGARVVWTSADGLDWEALGALAGPANRIAVFSLFGRAVDDRGPLPVADVLIDEGRAQRAELWTSIDGLTWGSLGVTYTYPEPALYPFLGPSGGYLATGDDYRLRVSGTGAQWTIVEGIAGLNRRARENGGTSSVSITRDAVLVVELPLTGERVLWHMEIDPPG